MSIAWLCPAHAGISRWESNSIWCSPSPPRIRGDQPLRQTGMRVFECSAPHTRGSTRPSHTLRRPCPLRPAHAGISPALAPSNVFIAAPPRTRGDCPGPIYWSEAGGASAPHTRGLTLRGEDDGERHSVRPAHAGIDRRTCSRCWYICSTPCIRGGWPRNPFGQPVEPISRPAYAGIGRGYPTILLTAPNFALLVRGSVGPQEAAAVCLSSRPACAGIATQ